MRTSVSQPFDAIESQSPNPPAQVTAVHVPVAQVVPVAFGRVHPVPHPPQLASVVTDVSHPFAKVPSQSP